MAGGLAITLWGASQSGEALLTQPGYADYPEQSTSSPDYMRDAQYNAEQVSAGMDRIALGVPVALAGLAIHTMAYAWRRETEQPPQIENLPAEHGG
jgi:hypothetical protein